MFLDLDTLEDDIFQFLDVYTKLDIKWLNSLIKASPDEKEIRAELNAMVDSDILAITETEYIRGKRTQLQRQADLNEVLEIVRYRSTYQIVEGTGLNEKYVLILLAQLVQNGEIKHEKKGYRI